MYKQHKLTPHSLVVELNLKLSVHLSVYLSTIWPHVSLPLGLPVNPHLRTPVSLPVNPHLRTPVSLPVNPHLRTPVSLPLKLPINLHLSPYLSVYTTVHNTAFLLAYHIPVYLSIHLLVNKSTCQCVPATVTTHLLEHEDGALYVVQVGWGQSEAKDGLGLSQVQHLHMQHQLVQGTPLKHNRHLL